MSYVFIDLVRGNIIEPSVLVSANWSYIMPI